MSSEYNSLTVFFRNMTESDFEEIWLTLKQTGKPKRSNDANFSDITRMIARAMSGLSAGTYISPACPISISRNTITIQLGLVVRVSAMNLEYTLASSLGELSDRKYINSSFSKNIVFRMTDTFQLPYEIKDYSYEWETPCYNSMGERVNDPTVTIIGSIITLSEVVFGVLRLNGAALEQQYTLLLKFPVSDAAKVKFTKVTITAKYIDETGQEQTILKDMDLPICAVAALSVCPDGSLENQFPGSELIPPGKEAKDATRIYYSTCDGDILLKLSYAADKVKYD